MTLSEIMAVVEEEDFNVTLSGGDPMCNPESTAILVKALKDNKRNVWLFTGYTWEEIISSPRLNLAVKDVDVLVDGPFIEAKKERDLLFRGSSNQRLINVPLSLNSQTPILYK